MNQRRELRSRIKDRENERNGEISFLLGGTYYRGWEALL